MIVEPRTGICARVAEACEAMVCDLQIYSRNKCDLDFLFVCLMCRFEMVRPRYVIILLQIFVAAVFRILPKHQVFRTEKYCHFGEIKNLFLAC